MYLKARLFALLLIVAGCGLVYYNWEQLRTQHWYSTKLAAFAPLCVVGGLYLLLLPSKAGKPETNGEKLTALLVFLIGLAAGLVNWYLMDPGFFGN